MGVNVKRRKTDNIWLFDYTSLNTLSDEQDKILFVSERDINIIYQGLKDVDRFITRVFTEVNGDVYTTVDFDQFEIFKQWISDVFNHAGDWRMTNELLERIAIAVEGLEALGCCPSSGGGAIGGVAGGSRGTGVQQAPISTFDETVEPFPEGFEDEADYIFHKCNAASDVVLHLKVDLLSLSNLSFEGGAFTALITLLIGVLITPVPFDDIGLLLGLLLAGGFEYAWLSILSGEIQDNADLLKCTIFNSDNATDAQSNLRAEVGEIITALALPGIAGGFLNDVVANLTPPDSINKVFEPGTTEVVNADCSDCAAENVFFINAPVGQPAPTLISGNLVTAGTIRSAYGFMFGSNRNYIILESTGEPQDNYLRITAVPDMWGGTLVFDQYNDLLVNISQTNHTTAASLIGDESLAINQAHFYSSVTGTDTPFEISFEFSTTPF